MTDEQRQEAIHKALSDVLSETELMPEGAMLTGWHVAFECRGQQEPSAGSMYGPATLTTWGALGLLQWGEHCLLNPDEDDDDDE